MVTMWAMATALRVVGDGEGESDGGNSNGGGDDVSQFSVRYEYLLWARPAKARR